MGHHLQARLPNCQTTFAEDEGHFSIITNYMKHALLTLKSDVSSHIMKNSAVGASAVQDEATQECYESDNRVLS